MISLIVHGPETIDNGSCIDLLNYLRSLDSVKPILAGTTGIKALIDSGLQDQFQYMRHTKVSEAVLDVESSSDVIVIYNDSKTIDGSLRFISIVTQKLHNVSCPVLYLDNFHVCRLNDKGHDIFFQLLKEFKVPLIEAPSRVDTNIREVHGALLGENIWINGNVIGIITSEYPRIWKDEGGSLHFQGIGIREHGLEHVSDFDPMLAQIRTGITRRTFAPAKSLELEKENKAVIIDHDAEAGLRYAYNSAYAVTIGDDTTRNSSSLLYRFSVPVVGIIDGDEDGICQEDIMYPGSIIFQVQTGTDDQIGDMISSRLFDGNKEIFNPPSLTEMASSIELLIGNRLVSKTF